ncbi:MAG TPA: EamA family transporter [Symbiobacteriaceae bacterium]|nr:EamA family transporter [Symbiobacteriaceae bacterium]
MQGLIFAILSAICWGLAPVAAKVALNHVSPIFALGVRSALATTMVTLWLQFAGEQAAVTSLSTKTILFLLIETLLATVVGDALYFYALQHGKAAQIGLVMASSPLITIMAASLLLHEPLTPLKVAGALVMVIGLLMVTI